MAENYKNSPIINDARKELEPGKNTKYANFLSQLANWGKVDRNNITALEQRFQDYINLCAVNDMKVGNQAAYLALGIDKNIAYNWEHGRSGTPQHCDFIKKVKQLCGSYREILMQDGQINPITGIFWQKNYDGLKDQQDVVVSPGKIAEDPATIAKRYKELTENIGENNSDFPNL